MKFFIKDLFKETADLVTFTEEILNGKLHLLFSDITNDGGCGRFQIFKR